MDDNLISKMVSSSTTSESVTVKENISTAIDEIDAGLEMMEDLLSRLEVKMGPILHRMGDSAEPGGVGAEEENAHSDLYQWAKSRAYRMRRQRNTLAGIIDRIEL